jgi:hypothetical protein
MRILVTGGRGFVGSSLMTRLAADGHDPVLLTRRARGAGEIEWNPGEGRLDPERLEGFDAVVHLAGEPIAAGRWNLEAKNEIHASRVESTRLLVRTLAQCRQPPKIFLSSSAVGYYGDRGDELLDETSVMGHGFLAAVCRDWESAAAEAESAFGARVVRLRFGAILGPGGGMLKRLVPLFRWGLGGRLGSGRQWMSWIALEDAVAAIRFLIGNEAIVGPVNLTSPSPLTNRGFTRALAKSLRRPAVFKVPAFALRLAVGGLADELLLASACVRPKALEAAGFRFAAPKIEEALERC